MPGALRSLDEGRELFVNAQETVKAVVASITRRYQLTSDQIDGLASDITTKLREDDYLILRRFKGRANLETYLAVVVMRAVRPIAGTSSAARPDSPRHPAPAGTRRAPPPPPR